ncbi:MAG: hypothetical protein KAW92_11345 [Candidatus Cloacimonetes bacterium]|nr:hypothetical protein [Candidatus Cloacimonadota bacterium]
MSLSESAKKAHQKLMLKVLAYSEAYIFVLEAEKMSLRNLAAIASKGSNENVDDTIHGSYLRLNNILKKYKIRPSQYYRSILFVDLIASVELFFVELIKAAIVEHPQKVGDSKFELKEVLRGLTVDELIERCANDFIHKLMYEKPEDYLEKMCSVLSIDSGEVAPFWPRFIEAKARRDLGVHNNWICNDLYIRKTKGLLGIQVAKRDEILLPCDRDYCNEVNGTIVNLSKTMIEMIYKKHS